MADEEKDVEVPQQKASGGIVKPALYGVGIFAAVLLAQIAAPPINRMIYGDPSAAAVEEETVDAEPAAAEMVAEIDPASLDPALYVPLDPALVVSLQAADGASHFLQFNAQAMTRDQDVANAIRDHAPAIRDGLLFVASRYRFEDVQSVEGKETLRSAMLTQAQDVMRRNIGKPGIEELYFTSFVAQ